ncbi:hypothetical protein HW555_006114, partial [Spodoptera exigua]
MCEWEWKPLFGSCVEIWRICNIILSFGCVIFSGTFGPFTSFAYILAGPGSEMATTCKSDPDYCWLMTMLNYLMWILFFASCLIICACVMQSICVIHCSMGLIVLDMLLSVFIFIQYLYYCFLYNRMCFSRKNASEDDASVLLHVFFLVIVFNLFLGSMLVFMTQYKR